MNYTLSDLIALVLNGARILSTEKGALEVEEDNRGLMCLVEIPRQPGRCILAVSSSHRLDPHVLSYHETARRHGFECEVITCGMRNVLDLYRLGKGRQRQSVGSESEAQRYIVDLIREATAMRASDLHIVARHDYCEIRCRIDGYLRPVEQLRPDEGLRICATIYQSMCDVAEPTFKPMQAQRARMKDEFLSECGLSGARINTRPLDRGMMMVLRLLYADSPGAAPKLADLGYLPEQCEAIEELMEHRTGVVLLSGPTGSGKSTTLKVVMQKLMAEHTGIHLLTLEDPPEYEIEGANQSPVSGERGSSAGVEQEWANAIADAMRLDPDVIMVGEVRDAVTAKMAFRAAMTGHLIWTTIHANDALAILPRLEDEGVMQSLLTDSSLVIGLVNQSLVQRLCNECSIPLKGNEELLGERLMKRLTRYCDLDGVRLQGDGCERCKQQGTAGRTVVAEVIRTSPGLMQAYIRGHHLEATRHWIQEGGGIGKADALIRKINQGIVDPRAGERIVGPIRSTGASFHLPDAIS
ncbi:Flp pilus assembly complex ATPase component TadA [Luteibacter jiangsuensis]|uniref:Flp pilus assembly complex ATPase component TadA n=1 Tax=Luteibacter jiangsuensis TaxID=637577 RepID=A0ABX0Q4P2_9GAMM|nr:MULTISPECIES: ATPase, T2SS/T4P/T4SS family [Luteibacter]NID04711.1 Flp pilus assembly complex ATPase component TadA [Luteibacter jiangsuensis]NII55586.1 type II secretory ATPase GspE/PulE/Tfp pilus assembly ATPase PilB-like protein [Luteibacter sp. SG786]